MTMLRQFGGESVIQIVGTHSDLCDVNDINNKCDEIIRSIQSDVNIITKDFDHRLNAYEHESSFTYAFSVFTISAFEKIYVS